MGYKYNGILCICLQNKGTSLYILIWEDPQDTQLSEKKVRKGIIHPFE